jgi:hypothetical protein
MWRRLRGKYNGGNASTVQYKSDQNCHYEAALYNEYFLIENLEKRNQFMTKASGKHVRTV